jgi:hypothetical protein
MLDLGACFDQSASDAERDTVQKLAEALYNSHIESVLENNKPVNLCAIWLTPELISYYENKWTQSDWPFKEDVANMIIAEGKKNNQELSKKDAFDIFFKYCKQIKPE